MIVSVSGRAVDPRLVRLVTGSPALYASEPMARSLLEQRLLDWFDQTISR